MTCRNCHVTYNFVLYWLIFLSKWFWKTLLGGLKTTECSSPYYYKKRFSMHSLLGHTEALRITLNKYMGLINHIKMFNMVLYLCYIEYKATINFSKHIERNQTVTIKSIIGAFLKRWQRGYYFNYFIPIKSMSQRIR